MNSTCLCDEKNKHIIMISTGFHEMSFKRYFVKRILKLDPNEIGEKIFNNDDLLNLYLSVNNHTIKFSIQDYQNCHFSPIKIDCFESIFPKNFKAGIKEYDINLSEETENKLNNYRITLILHHPYERFSFYFCNKFLFKETFNDLDDKSKEILLWLEIPFENLTFDLFIESLHNKINQNDTSDLIEIFDKQILDDELVFEKIENLANLLIISSNDIDSLFPGYSKFISDNLVKLTTLERLSSIKGIYDLNDYNVSHITRNHIRSGSFNLHLMKFINDTYKTDLVVFNKYKHLFVSEAKQYFICGCVRSGTSYVASLLGKYITNGLHFLNESGRYPAHLRWKLRGSFFVFKFCEDVKQIPILIDYFPNCRIIHLTRDIRDIIYTICYPSENSWPIRKVEDFPKIQEIQKSLDCSLINAIAKFIEIHYCLEDWDI